MVCGLFLFMFSETVVSFSFVENIDPFYQN